ncbi:hypothetical protein [Halorarum salinum]|uniref:Uncharacterized protein n=1 Tax=Halorarum salinum TaxID=2743089 RepID=A0A7D5L8D4_9EURY|nr:hypothetical protein [Halobaculum salinum]QLG60468.1 hypothetical protein HUG12_01350 [Halobaculum salinum]
MTGGDGRGTGRRQFLGALGVTLGGTALLGRVGSRSVAAGQSLQHGYYTGSTTNVIRYFDAFGQSVLGEQAYQHDVLVRVGTPAVAGGVQETNPFNLYVIPDPSSITGEEGVMEIHSALGYSESPGETVLSPITGDPVPNSAGGVHETTAGSALFQYWRYDFLSGDEFRGELVDPHTQEALAINLFNAANEIAPGISLPWPYPMAAGTQLAATIDGTDLTITISGFSIDLTRQFLAQIEVTRFA